MEDYAAHAAQGVDAMAMSHAYHAPLTWPQFVNADVHVSGLQWRHWGTMTGPLRCPLGHGWLEADPSNEVIEIFGSALASVTPDFQITRIEIFYDPADIMNQMVRLATTILLGLCNNGHAST